MKLFTYAWPVLVAASSPLLAQSDGAERSTVADFLKSDLFSQPDVDSKYMAKKFSSYQALPLAWYPFPPDSYCIRLVHTHSGSSAPTRNSIAIEFRGRRGQPALLVADVANAGVKWTAKIIPETVADELLKLIDEGRLYEPSPQEPPGFISTFWFNLELRAGQQYRFVRYQAPSENTDRRGLRAFLSTVTRLIEIAEVPNSEVFYGP